MSDEIFQLDVEVLKKIVHGLFTIIQEFLPYSLNSVFINLSGTCCFPVTHSFKEIFNYLLDFRFLGMHSIEESQSSFRKLSIARFTSEQSLVIFSIPVLHADIPTASPAVISAVFIRTEKICLGKWWFHKGTTYITEFLYNVKNKKIKWGQHFPVFLLAIATILSYHYNLTNGKVSVIGAGTVGATIFVAARR